MKEMFVRVMKEEEGQGMVEYGIIIAGIAVAVIATIWLLGPVINNMFNNVLNTMNT